VRPSGDKFDRNNKIINTMGIFKTSKLLYGNPDFINTIATAIESKFRADGYDVRIDDTYDNGKNIDISKGGLFKRVLGMRTALKVSLSPCDGNIWFKTDVGIFGNQVIPTILVASGMWIILLPQIWGLVHQARLDDKVLEIAERIIYASGRN
jgi:hypothetical protein